MGVIAAIRLAAGKGGLRFWWLGAPWMKQEIAWWIILSCHAGNSAWRTGGRLAHLGEVPISTTHAIGAAVSGVGAVRGLA